MKSLSLADFMSPEFNEKIQAADKISITVFNLMDLIAVQALGGPQFSARFRTRIGNLQNKAVEIHVDLFGFYDRFNPNLIQFLFSEFSLCPNLQAFSLIFSKNSYKRLDANSCNFIINVITGMSQRGCLLHLTLKEDDFGEDYYDGFGNEGSEELEYNRGRNDEISEVLRLRFLNIRSLNSLTLVGNEFVNFSNNELKRLFHKFRECAALERLSLRGCGIERLTPQMRGILFSNLDHVQELDLTYNRCYELPFEEASLLFSHLSVKKVFLFDNLPDIDSENIAKIFKILALFPKLEAFGYEIGFNKNKPILEERRLAILAGLSSLKGVKLVQNKSESTQRLISLIDTFCMGINGSSSSGLLGFIPAVQTTNLTYLPSGGNNNNNNNNARRATDDEGERKQKFFKMGEASDP